MSLQFKRRFNENLDLIPVYIEDTSLTSEAYFGIKEFPSFFGRGKNGVRIKPNEDILKPNSQLYIEILDVNLNSVYYEIPDYEPGDLSRYISVWVYGERDDMYNTPNGIGEMIICGIAERTEDGEIIPEEFRNVINVRWRRKISINRDSRSESPIIFSNNELPTIAISESISSYLNFADENGQLLMVSESINETIVYSSDFTGENVFLTLPTTSSYNFSSNLPGNKIYFNLQNVTLSPTITSAEGSAGLLKPVNYTASVESIVNSKKLRVSNPLTASVTTKFESILKTFTSFSTGSFTIEVPTTGSQTPFSQSLLHITLNDVNPIIGNVDKINVYIRPKSFETTNQYKFVGTKILNSTISSSITDIYSNTPTNFTQSTHTFVYQAEKQNDLNDIKVEFVNSLNDESLYFIEKKDAFLAGYNRIDSASYSQLQTIQQVFVTTEMTASRILLSNNNFQGIYNTNGGSTSSLSTITFRDIGTTISSNQSIGRIAFESFDTDTVGSGSSQAVRAFIEAVSEDTSPDSFLTFGTAPSGSLAQERLRITSVGNVGIGTTSPTEKFQVVGNSLITGNLTVGGRITAEEFHTEFISSSIIYQSGSTQFGNSLDDTHIFTGSLNLTGSLRVNGKTIDESINSASVSYVSQSGDIYTGLNQIEVQDFSNDVAVNWVSGRLKFVFGTPTIPTSIALTLSGFDTDRFNRVLDAYSINGSWSNGGYNIISASLYTGSVLLTSTTSGTSLSTTLTTSGSQSYRLQYTASSPLDGSIFSGSASATGTLNKLNPGAPTLTLTPLVQLDGISNQIERGATGSISFTSASGAANGWVLNFVSTNFNSPYIVTGSATGSAPISITATAYYSSSGVNGSHNNPALTTTTPTTTTYTKIVSLRYGASSNTSFTEAQLDNLSGWDTTLGGSIGTIVKGTVNPSGQSVTITWTGDKYHYIVYGGSRSDLTNITTSGFGVLGSFSVSTVGNYKVYKTTTLQAGGAGGSSITYVLT